MAADESILARSQPETRRQVVAGHYEIVDAEPLGEGGMAVVYRGRDQRTRREVALKTLRDELRTDPETRARFRREARTMAFLTHPNVARVYDLYEDDIAPWAVLEFVPGLSLKDALAERGPFGVEETALILEQVARALDHLHKRGMVHLDVKPQNLVQTPDGIVKLIDFGLAQRAGEPQETIGGATFGTVAYLSPEQATGQALEAPADVYSLGCVVYELLTGQPPFRTDDPDDEAGKGEIVRAHIERVPLRPTKVNPDLPAWIDQVVLGALAKEPEERYPDCGSFAATYRQALEEAMDLEDRPVIVGWAPPKTGGLTVDEELPEVQPAGSLTPVGRPLLRRTAGLRRAVWRVTVLLAIMNLLLAGLLWFSRGEVPGIYEPDAAVAPGAQVRVLAEGVRLRAEPGEDAPVVGAVGPRDTITVSGPQILAGGGWWPVTVDNGVFTSAGYISAEWIDGVRETPKDQLIDWVKNVFTLG